MPITLNPTPLTWIEALTAIIEGRRVVITDIYRADRGRGERAERHVLNAGRIRSGPLSGDTWHAEHKCPIQGMIEP